MSSDLGRIHLPVTKLNVLLIITEDGHFNTLVHKHSILYTYLTIEAIDAIPLNESNIAPDFMARSTIAPGINAHPYDHLFTRS